MQGNKPTNSELALDKSCVRTEKHSASMGACISCTISRVKAILDSETPEYTREQIAAWMDTSDVEWAIEDEEVRNELEDMMVLYAAAEYMRSAKVPSERTASKGASSS